MQRVENLILPESIDRPGIINEISKVYSIIRMHPKNKEQSFFDTFDWRLYNKGLTLLKEATVYHLRPLQQDRGGATSLSNSKIQPKFWWEFPDGSLKEELKSYLNVRALLHLASMQTRSETLRILGQDEKTVLRAHLEEIRIGNGRRKPGLIRKIRLQPVRGYEREVQEFSRFLHNLGLKSEKRDVFATAVEAYGKRPGDYSSKLNMALSPEWPGNVAAKKIFAYLLHVMKQNEAGIKADLDTEFLHDFRVAIRRTRSALTQIKGVFPKEIADHYKRDFASLGKLTNRLRDLDVYLLKRVEYQGMLPENLSSDLEPMFETLCRERKREHRKMVKALGAAPYKKIIGSWEEFINQPAAAKGDAAKYSNKPVLELARKFIWQKYNQVMTLGKAITDYSPDPELHSLRIECKKLRYLLEFFVSLFPTNEMANLIKQLKKLQDNLGDFNDLFVQQESLKEFLCSDIKSEKYQNTTAAIGGLIAVLFQRQQRVRQAFAQTFTQFSDSKNAALFNKLFG